jgi:hypothetical protein
MTRMVIAPGGYPSTDRYPGQDPAEHPELIDALAQISDVEARREQPLTQAQRDRLPALLMDASALVAGYCRRDFTAPVPRAVVGTVARAAARALAAPAAAAGVESETTGPFTARFREGSTEPYLTKADHMVLRPYRAAGVTSVSVTSERFTGAATVPVGERW